MGPRSNLKKINDQKSRDTVPLNKYKGKGGKVNEKKQQWKIKEINNEIERYREKDRKI